MHERLIAPLPASSATTSQAAFNTHAANQCTLASSALSASSDVVDATVALASTSTCAEKNDDSGSRRFTRDAVELLRRQLDGRSGDDLLRLRLDPNTSESEKKTVECLLYVPAIQKCMYCKCTLHCARNLND